MGPTSRKTLLALGLFLGLTACTKHRPARKPIVMEAIPPPEAAPHQKTTLAAGGGATFEADDLIGVDATEKGIVRVYATNDTMGLIGVHPGKVTLELHLVRGDIFYLDVEVTDDAPTQQARHVGDPFVITYDGVKEYALSGRGLEAEKTADGKQLTVIASEPGPAIVALTMADGSIHRVELLIIGGETLL